MPLTQPSQLAGNARIESVHNLPTLACRVRTENAGTVWAFRTAPVIGLAVSITNQLVVGPVEPAVERVLFLAKRLVQLNRPLQDTVAVGWWRDPSDRLFVDLNLVVDRLSDAACVAQVFHQLAIARMTTGGAVVIDIDASDQTTKVGTHG